jgi:peptide/nickel transport system permease protein
MATASAAIDSSFRQVRVRTWRNRLARGMMSDWSSIVAVALLVGIAGSALLAPQIAPHDPLYQTIVDRLKPPFWMEDGTPDYPLGTDQLGRDILSRIIYGGRISLQLGLTAATISGILGVTIGLISGYAGGRTSNLLMRLADVQHAFPFLVLAIAIIAVLNRGKLELFGVKIPVDQYWALIFILSIWGWSGFARVTRAGVLTVKEREYVQGARAIGAGRTRILLRHILPNILSPIIILWTFALASLIIAESSLSFLGFGVRPPTPSWGNMLAEGRSQLANAWWLATFPGIAIMLTVLAVNLLGDRLRDLLDPRFQV